MENEIVPLKRPYSQPAKVEEPKPKSKPKPKPKVVSKPPYFIDFQEDLLTKDGVPFYRAFIVDKAGKELPHSSGFGMNHNAAKEDMVRRCSVEILLKLFE